MKIPAEAIISRAKLVEYLLQTKLRNDKSEFLAQAGFTQSNPEELEAALRRLIAGHEAYCDRVDAYGDFYCVDGALQGPNGGMLSVVTVWILEKATRECRFVTLKPARQPR